MDPVDAYDKENPAGVAGAGGGFMKATASSKSRFGAPSPIAPGLRPNLNNGSGATRPATARADFAASRSAPTSPTRASRPAGVADLNSFRARLNVVKRESMMRQGGGVLAGGVGSNQSLDTMQPIGEMQPQHVMQEQMFGGEDPFEGGNFGSDQIDSVHLINSRNFEDPEFVDVLEKCLHWRPKALKGYDMKALKEEARVAINNLKQCLQQSLVRKENLVEDAARAEGNLMQTIDGLKLSFESATHSKQVTAASLEATKSELDALTTQSEAVVSQLNARNESLTRQLKKQNDDADFDKLKLEDALEAKNVELQNLRRRHEEATESLRAVRDDLKETRELLLRAERETVAVRRDRENGESSYAAERKALESQIRSKIDEVAESRLNMSKQKHEMESVIRGHVERVEKLTVQNKLLTHTVEETEVGMKSKASSLSARLAETETELESSQRALSREKLRFNDCEKDLTKALIDTRGKCDDLEQKLSNTSVEVASLKEALTQQKRLNEDTTHGAFENLNSKNQELESAGKQILSLRHELSQKDVEMKALSRDLKNAKDSVTSITHELENASSERREERARLAIEIDRFKLEAGENKGRADALLAQQAQLLLDIKEERARVARTEEERASAVAGGAATAEYARQQAREDLRLVEDRHQRAREEMVAEKLQAVQAAREKAALEIASARADAAKAVSEAEATCAKAVAEAEAKATAASEAAKKTAEAAVEEADGAADNAEALVEELKTLLEKEKALCEQRVADIETKLSNAETAIAAKTAECAEKLELAKGDASVAVEGERALAEQAAAQAEAALEALRTELREALAASAEEAAQTLALEREKAEVSQTEANETLTQLKENFATLSTESKETCDVLRLEIEVAKVSAADAISKFAALETANAIVAAEASEATQKHAELVELAASAESRVQNVVAQLENEQREVDRLEKQAEEAKESLVVAAERAEAAMKSLVGEKADMECELRALRAAAGIGDDGEELSEEQRLAAAADFEQVAQQNDMSAKDASALTSRLVKATKAAEAARRVATDMETHKKIAEERLRRIEELETQALDADATRRALHNQIQELRGNVRVFCRVRPTTSDTAVVTCPADGSSVSLTKENDSNPVGFEFDRVFSPQSTQAEVFEEVSQLVQSALDGYKVCLFSYGQTGSGKTHTMLGEQGVDSAERGVIPRAVAKIVEASEKNKQKGWTYEMHASYVEIYNEQVRDLLSAGAGHSDKHSIVHTKSGVTEVSGVKREAVTSVAAAANLVRRASNARAVEATQMNAVSSRSHTIFMLYISGEHKGSGSTLSGCLNLVDLAGSERVGRSGAEGARLKEACAINKSLSCLGDVFQALSNKQAHVPYRNSKLTYLLQPCLGGDGKTLMFVNINPEAPSAEETLCSLKFAAQVNAVELGGGRGGGAKRNITSGMTRDAEKKEDTIKEEKSLPEKETRPKSAVIGGGERVKDKRARESAGPGPEAKGKSKIPTGVRPATARPALGPGAAKKIKRAP
jgi:kinesin family protein C1